MASVVACGDMVSHRGEIVITPGSEQQVAEALRVKPSKLNRFKPDRKLAKKIKDRLAEANSGASASYDTGDTGDTGGSDTGGDTGGSGPYGDVEGGFDDCDTSVSTEEIDCGDLADALDAMSTSSATEGPDCTCTAKSWCEEDADGACICYTAVSDCG